MWKLKTIMKIIFTIRSEKENISSTLIFGHKIRKINSPKGEVSSKGELVLPLSTAFLFNGAQTGK